MENIRILARENVWTATFVANFATSIQPTASNVLQIIISRIILALINQPAYLELTEEISYPGFVMYVIYNVKRVSDRK